MRTVRLSKYICIKSWENRRFHVQIVCCTVELHCWPLGASVLAVQVLRLIHEYALQRYISAVHCPTITR